MHTGDLATLDAEGYCNVVGRRRDVVIWWAARGGRWALSWGWAGRGGWKSECLQGLTLTPRPHSAGENIQPREVRRSLLLPLLLLASPLRVHLHLCCTMTPSLLPRLRRWRSCCTCTPPWPRPPALVCPTSSAARRWRPGLSCGGSPRCGGAHSCYMVEPRRGKQAGMLRRSRSLLAGAEVGTPFIPVVMQ